MINHIIRNSYIVLGNKNDQNPSYILEVLLCSWSKVTSGYSAKNKLMSSLFNVEYLDEIILYANENSIAEKLQYNVTIFICERIDFYEEELKIAYAGGYRIPGKMAYCFYEAPLSLKPVLCKNPELAAFLPEKLNKFFRRIDQGMFIITG